MATKTKSKVKGGISKSGMKKKIEDLNTNLVSMTSELKNLHDNLNGIMTGDSDGPYWNGKKAARFYKKACGNIKNDIDDYSDAFDKFSRIANAFDGIDKQDRD